MFLLLLAGLLSLPKEPFLAASIDGAGPIRKFIYVTFPLMAPISIGAIIIRLIEASKIMDTVYVLTSGGPGTATETSSYYIFIKGLREFQIGYSAALSFTYLIIMIISLTIISKLLVKLLIKKFRYEDFLFNLKIFDNHFVVVVRHSPIFMGSFNFF